MSVEKTKLVITLANQEWQRECSEPIKAQSNYVINMWTFVPAKFFSVIKNVWDFLSPQNLNFWRFPDGFWRLSKIPKIAEGFRQLSKIAEDEERFLMTSKQLLFAEKNKFLFNRFKQLHLRLSVRREKLVWMREITISDSQARQTHA